MTNPIAYDLIDRQSLIRALHTQIRQPIFYDAYELYRTPPADVLSNYEDYILSADALLAKTSRLGEYTAPASFWIKQSGYVECNRCHSTAFTATPFCPQCGSRLFETETEYLSFLRDYTTKVNKYDVWSPFSISDNIEEVTNNAES